MELFYFLFSTEYLLFTICVGIAFFLGLLFFIIGEIDDDIDFDIEESPVLNYLGFGKVPVLVGILSLLLSFGVSGILLQTFMVKYFWVLPWFIAVIPSGIISVVITRHINMLVAKYIPNFESYDIKLEDLIDSMSTIVLPAKAGSVTEAKVIDELGKTHYIRIKVKNDVEKDDQVALTTYHTDKNIFE